MLDTHALSVTDRAYCVDVARNLQNALRDLTRDRIRAGFGLGFWSRSRSRLGLRLRLGSGLGH